MLQTLYDGGDNALWTVILVTFVMGGGTAFISGRAIAQTWRPFWHVPLYMLGLALIVRFWHFALFDEPFLSLKSYVADFIVAFTAAALGYQLMRARQMATQYDWLFRRYGLLGWRRRQPGGVQD